METKEPPSWTRFIGPTSAALGAVLMLGMIFMPTLGNPRRKMRHSQAKSDALQVRQAIETFFTEYNRFPVVDSSTEQTSQPFYSDHDVMDALMGSDATSSPEGLNPRRITFYAGKKAKGNPPKAGVVLDKNGGGELFDPWGNHYRIVIDLSRDNRIEPPIWSKDRTPIPQSVIVWSPGPDGEDSTAKDNVTTW